MGLTKENPAPGCGVRVSEFVEAAKLDGSECTPHVSISQTVEAGFAPDAMPIIARHWLGLSTEGEVA